LLEVEDNVIAVDFGDATRRYRNHDVERLVEIVGIDGAVRVCDEYIILRFDHGNLTSSCFSIADADEPWIPCNYNALTSITPDALAERIKTHGGFVVPGRDVLKSIESRKR